MIQNRKILLAISGSIAAYKCITLVRLLTKAGADVRVVLTPAAENFVSPLVLETLTRQPVISGLAAGSTWANHVMLGRWADLLIVAPASCNTIAKMAGGLCDNLLLAVYLSATCPVWLAPAMDEDMWLHPSTRRNLSVLESYGNRVLEVGNGELASGLTGQGRMAEPEAIFSEIEVFFGPKKLAGKKAFVTAGPTYEQIDPVRFIGNHSSGKMGIELALALQHAGADTTLIAGPVTVQIPESLKVVRVQSAIEMFDAAVSLFKQTDIAIMAAAVADYRPREIASEKIKKKEDSLTIELVKNPDILKHCGTLKQPGQFLVGFALETNNEQANAKAKLANKNADIIVLNSLNDAGAGFGKPTNKVTIFQKDGSSLSFPVLSKKEVATEIVSFISKKIHETI